MELARAYVQIVPTTEGITGSISSALMPEASSAGDEAGSEAGASFADKLKTAIAAAGIGIAVKKAFDAVGDVAAFGDEIDKTSQKIGISAKAYQEWSAVLQHSGTDVSVMKSALKTLSNAAVDGSDAFEKLGISQEEAMSMSQEDLFARVIEGLQGMEAGSERAALAQDLLGRGAQEMAALLNTSAAETQAMKDRVNELGGVMSDDAVAASAAYQDSLQDMQTAIGGLARGILAEFLPSITQVMDGLTQVFSGDGEGMQLVVGGVQSLVTTIAEAVPSFLEAGANIIVNIAQGILEALPGLWEAGTQMIPQVVEGFLNNLPSIISAGGRMLNGLINYIMQNLPRFLTQGVQLIGRLAMGILRALPQIIGSLARVLAQLIATIVRNLPQFLSQGIQLIGKLAMGIIRAIPQVVRTVPQIFRNVSSAFRNIDWGSLGKQVINGIKRGISNGAQAVVKAAKDLAKNAFDAAKNFLGISSPSKKFIWVAEMSAAGIVKGAKEAVPDVQQAMSGLARSALGAFDAEYGRLDAGVNVYRNDDTASIVDEIRALAQTMQGLHVVMDTGVTVGALAPQMSTRLQTLSTRQARRMGET